MRIAILGTGAIGGVLAGCLSDTNAELVCVSRGRTARDLLEGLTLFTPEGCVEMIPGERFEIIDSEKGPLQGIIASRVGWERVLGGTTTHSAWRDGDGAVHWTGRGTISLGSVNSSEPNSIATEFISLLDEGGLVPNWSIDIEGEIWRSNKKK